MHVTQVRIQMYCHFMKENYLNDLPKVYDEVNQIIGGLIIRQNEFLYKTQFKGSILWIDFFGIKKQKIMLEMHSKYEQEFDAYRRYREAIHLELQSERSRNLDVLHSIKNNLQLQWNKISDIFNMAKSYIDTQINVIKEFTVEFQEALQISSNHNFLSYSELICQETTIYQNIQVQLLEFIKKINFDQFQLKCKETLNQISFDGFKFQETFLKNINMKNNLNNESEVISQWICDDHKNKIYYVDLNTPQVVPSRLACFQCVTKYFIQYKTLDTLKQLWEQEMLQIQINIEKNNNCINNYMVKAQENLVYIKDQICQLIDRSLDQINSITQNKNQVFKSNSNLLKKDWHQLEKEDITSIANILSQKQDSKTFEEEIKSQRLEQVQLIKTDIQNSQQKILLIIRDQIQKFQDHFCPLINQELKDNSQEVNSQRQINEIKQSQFKFQLLKESCFKEESISVITFNNEANIMIAGYVNNLIKIFKFDNGKLRLIQSLNHHQDRISCLHFMKKSQIFVSGAGDNVIVIWQVDGKQIWQCQQQLDGHLGSISCLVVSKNENLMISGGADKKIMIWKKVVKWIPLQTLTYHNKEINSLSLSQSENKLISCAYQETMIILSTYHDQNQLWKKVKQIQTIQWGISLNFINDKLFTFQPYNEKVLEIYSRQKGCKDFLNRQKKTLKRSNLFISGFPQIYNRSKSVLVFKSGSQIYIFNIKEDFEFIFDSLIEFESDHVVGSITSDCKYLVTWDDQTKQIKIRKLIEQQ